MIYSEKELHKIIEQSLIEFLPKSDTYSSVLEKAEDYSLTAGGKRLRPCILLAVCQMLGGDVKSSLPFAIALEFIHTYSLIHDDLPAMDNDDFRRGKPSNHKMFGEDIAILAGDALLTRAFEIVSEDMAEESSFGKTKAFNAISHAAYDMVRGQIADIHLPDDLNLDYLNYVHRYKTAALFKAAFAAGAYLADANENTVNSMADAGVSFGHAFQIYDDYLDADSGEQSNYVTFAGKEESIKKVHEYLDSVKEIVGKYSNNEALLALLEI